MWRGGGGLQKNLAGFYKGAGNLQKKRGVNKNRVEKKNREGYDPQRN